jgi:hypothetical protein
MRAFCSSGKVAARSTTARRALASEATAAFALSKLPQTSTAMKPTNRANRMPNGGSNSGRDRLEGPRSVVHRECNHNPIDAGGKEITGRKDNNGHPQHRKIEQPVAHYRLPSNRRSMATIPRVLPPRTQRTAQHWGHRERSGESRRDAPRYVVPFPGQQAAPARPRRYGRSWRHVWASRRSALRRFGQRHAVAAVPLRARSHR